jgi:hypothetical protein
VLAPASTPTRTVTLGTITLTDLNGRRAEIARRAREQGITIHDWPDGHAMITGAVAETLERVSGNGIAVSAGPIEIDARTPEVPDIGEIMDLAMRLARADGDAKTEGAVVTPAESTPAAATLVTSEVKNGPGQPRRLPPSAMRVKLQLKRIPSKDIPTDLAALQALYKQHYPAALATPAPAAPIKVEAVEIGPGVAAPEDAGGDELTPGVSAQPAEPPEPRMREVKPGEVLPPGYSYGIDMTTGAALTDAPETSPETPQVKSTITITRLPDWYGRTKHEETIELETFAGEVLNTVIPVGSKDDTRPMVLGARLGNTRDPKSKSLKIRENVVAITALFADIDGDYGHLTPEEAAEKAVGVGAAAIVFPTKRHTPEAPRLRCVVPLSREHSVNQLEPLLARLNGLLGGVISPDSADPERGYFYGRFEGTAQADDYEVYCVHEGLPLDLVPPERLPPPIPLPDRETKGGGGAALGPRPAHIAAAGGVNINANAAANLPEIDWFARLAPERMNALLDEILKIPEIAALANVPRLEGWLKVMAALVDAEALGADQAYTIARAFSETSTRFNAEKFDQDWKNLGRSR